MIDVAVAGGVATVTMNHPPVNALGQQFLLAIRDAFRGIAEQRGANVAILRSGLPAMFSAGADLKEKTRTPADRLRQWGMPGDFAKAAREAEQAIYECPVPVIASIGGVTIAGGFVFASLCDFIVASESASFGLLEIQARVVGGCQVVRRIMPEAAMRYLMWTAERVSARELQQLGAAIVVVPDAALDARTAALAAALAGRDPQVVRLTKMAMNEVEGMRPLAAYQIEQKYTAIIAGADMAQAMRASGG